MAMTIIERILQAYKVNDIVNVFILFWIQYAFYLLQKTQANEIIMHVNPTKKNFQHVDDSMNQMKTVSLYSLQDSTFCLSVFFKNITFKLKMSGIVENLKKQYKSSI